jgi:hypothetical protein
LLISSALSLAIADTAGTVTHLSGTLTVQKPDGAQKILAVKSQVESGDTLITAPEAFARIKFVDKSEIVLRPETTFQISDYKFNPDKPEENKSFSNLVKGGMRSVTGLIGQQDKEKVKFETPTATIGIRGTHFGLLNCAGNCASVPTVTGNPPPDGLHVDVSQGGVSVTNAAGTLNLNPGEFGFVQSPNTPPVQVPPNQGIQVSMPSNISQNDAGGKGGVGGSKSGGCTVQ